MAWLFKKSALLAVAILVFSVASCASPVEESPATTTATRQPPPATTQVAPTTTVPATTQVAPTSSAPLPSTTQPFLTVTTAPATTTAEPVTTPPAPTTSYDPYRYYRGYLLEGYPEDIWPIYESVGIDSCSLDFRYPAFNRLYGDCTISYAVVYKSKTEKEDIVERYLALLSEPEESGWYDAAGTLEGYSVSVRVDDNRSPSDVYISVGVPDNSPMTSNPLMEDFPEEQFPLYEQNEIWAEIYNVNSNPPSGEQFAEIYFSHSGTRNEALEFYRDLFAAAEGYEEVTVDEWKGEETTLTGYKYDYNFKIVIGLWGDAQVIQLRLTQPL